MSKDKYVTLESIQQHRNDVPIKDFPTRIGTFNLYGLTSLELQQWRTYLRDNEGSDYNEVSIMMFGCRDADGKRIFNDGALLQLIELGADITEAVCDEIMTMSGVGNRADVQIVKNLTTRITALESDLKRISEQPTEN